jgi:hypothetical protein
MKKTREIILHLHGFASSAHSAKAVRLKERLERVPHAEFLVPDFNPTPKDFEFLTVTGMLNRLRQYIVDRGIDQVNIIASSLGGLVALHYAARFGKVKRLLLLAPVLSYNALPFPAEMFAQWKEEGSITVPHHGFKQDLLLRYDFHRDGLLYAIAVPPSATMLILHGRNDATISIQNSRDYAARYPDMVTLVELDSDHALLDSLEIIGEHAVSFLLS